MHVRFAPSNIDLCWIWPLRHYYRIHQIISRIFQETEFVYFFLCSVYVQKIHIYRIRETIWWIRPMGCSRKLGSPSHHKFSLQHPPLTKIGLRPTTRAKLHNNTGKKFIAKAKFCSRHTGGCWKKDTYRRTTLLYYVVVILWDQPKSSWRRRVCCNVLNFYSIKLLY